MGDIGKRGSVVGILMVLSAVWSKTSFAVTIMRLCKRWMQICLWVIIVTMNFFMIFSALINFIQCTPVEKLWNPMAEGSCWDPRINVGFGIFAGAYSALMDMMLSLIPWAIVWNLQMKRREKLGVAVAMSMGIL